MAEKEELDRLAREQEKSGMQIVQQMSNCKKDSIDRKTEAYVQKHLTNLDAILQTIQQNEAAMIKIKGYSEHQYVTKQYAQQLYAKYDELKTYLLTCPKAKPTKIQSELPIVSIQEKLIKTQNFKIQQLEDTLAQIRSELTLEKSEFRYKHLMESSKKQWDAIQNLHEEIAISEDSHQDKYRTMDMYKQIQKQFDDVIEALATRIQQDVVIPTQQILVNQPQQNLQLPKVQIPIFHGGYENWTTFFDIFRRVIHENSALNKADKMHYLKTNTRGEASKLIQHLEAIAANYDSAWDLLQKRYENKRLLIFKLLDKLIELPEVSKENAEKLKQLHDVTSECLQALKNLDVKVDTWGPIVIRMTMRKWDPETSRLYEQSLEKPHDVPELEEFMKFLERRFQSLETIPASERQRSSEKKYTNSSCLFCQDQHMTYQCQKFKGISAQERNRYVQEKRICYNCLSHDINKRCFSHAKCSICSRQHHTLLHMEKQQNSNRQPNYEERPTTSQPRNAQRYPPPKRAEHYHPPRGAMSNHASRNEENVLLATALVEVSTSSSPQILRILIDQGSQISIITEEAANRLGLPRHSIRAQISGIGDGEPKISKWSIDAQIKPRFMSTFSMDVNMIVLPKLTQSMPKRHLHINSIDSWKNEVLADPTFMTPGAIDGILGAKEYANIILNGMQKSTEGLLKQNTELGWIVSGPITSGFPAIQVVSMITHYEEDRQLTKFWEIEEIPQVQHLTEEEQACEEIFEETTTRDSDGRFIVRIPFKQSAEVLGHSKPRAAARFKNIERKLHQDPSLLEQYSAFMKEYTELDHMRKVTRNEVNQGKYYIPHQAVIREASTTTRLRVVFDASCKSSTNISLNDIMHVGPRLQQNIADILLRWRKHEIVFCADIEKMYRQIRIHPDDQQFQRILWREHPQQPMYEYELTTVTYGTASAPYLAIKTLQKLAIDEANQFPEASQAALRDFYVDDILSGAADTESALELQKQLLKMLSLAGFNLRKWSSNSQALLQSIPEQFREQKIQELPQEDFKKSLGVLWSPADDSFKFQVKVAEIRELTKRQILSEISKLFDPLGWLSPIVIQAKLIIQDLWLRNLSWDEPVDQDISSRWIHFQSKIKEVEKIKIPRWIHLRKTKIELHGFCDASEKAYGAVIYSRIEEEDKQIITLLQAKSKVAPAKNRTTLPRLELCAAVLLSKLIQKTKTALQMGDTQTFAWTDSMITLAWIKGDSTRWKTFVANRVCEIHRNAPQASWNHVKSQENPADIISRGLDPDKLQSADLWWKGPHWLTSLREIPTTENIPDIQEEVKATCHKIEVTIRSEIWERFSNLTRMLRVLSYCRRFIKKGESLTLSVQEIQETFERIIKIVQQQEFSEEYKSLQQNSVDKKSKLLTLNPFLDSKGIIRVGGRLEHSTLTYDQRHPMILPYHSHITTLVVRNAHKATLHGGNQATLSNIRSRFWIINGKRAVKAVINKCIVCIRHKAETAQQLMGQLPKSRVTPAPPFTNSGVDYAGPIQVRATKGRGHKSYKGYIAVFVCLATKAIHLEVVSDMTTEAFLAALRRFTARRGHCANMYSDNGTTFVGAARLFEDEISKLIHSQSVQNTIVNLGTQWHFIPPAAPHFGGIWEAGVKSMKHHLKRIIGDCTLTYEELTTLVYQIEACLNSRPLCPLTEDTDDFNILTPGHFLIGRELLAPPNLESTEQFNLSQRWRHVQKLKKNIWSAWCTEYLTRLQQRYKWKNQTNNLRVGTMVLIKEENINPNQWPLGRIIETHQGQDGAIRVVTIKKAGGSPQKRPIHKLIPLPTEDIHHLPTTENHSEVRRSERLRNIASTSTKSYVLFFLAAIIMMITTAAAETGFQIHYPQHGFYVEHLGSAKIDRGMFRIETTYPKNKTEADLSEVSTVVKQFKNMCNKSKKLTDEVKCTSLVQHLEEMENHSKWICATMADIHHRTKRGLFGKFLTAVFGVNDEVYQDIEAMNNNQEELIRASNYQTKFMISALTKFNETEARISNKLQHFQKRLNEGIEAINNMQSWYKRIDTNALNIHLLSAYQVASNFISETNEHYDKLLNINFNRGTIYDQVSPAYINAVIQKSNRKLPNNLKILSTAVSTKLITNNTHLKMCGYFPIVDVTEFTLLKATPIPLRIENDTYWALDLPDDYTAIDYNSQTYFQLQESDLQQCMRPYPHQLICSPVSVRKIESNPSCVIDEIYERPQPRHCRIQQHRLKGILWKRLCTKNTWMFIADSSTTVAVICNGEREDVAINTTGIIQISQDCTIQTNQNILTPLRSAIVPVVGSYVKAVPIIFNGTLHTHPMTDIATEPVFRETESFGDLMREEEDLGDRLHNKVWRSIHHYSAATSSITTIVIIFLVIAGWQTTKLVNRRRQRQTREQHQDQNEEIELMSLHSSILERPQNV